MLLCELVLGTFLTSHELTLRGCSRLAVCCVVCCIAVFTGSGDACARAFNSKSGVLQKIFRGHKFIINCIQVREEFLCWDFLTSDCSLVCFVGIGVAGCSVCLGSDLVLG